MKIKKDSRAIFVVIRQQNKQIFNEKQMFIHRRHGRIVGVDDDKCL